MDEAVAAARAALAVADDTQRPRTLLLLAQALRLRSGIEAPGGLTGDTPDEAIALLGEVLSTGGRVTLHVEAYGLLSELLCARDRRVRAQDAAAGRHADGASPDLDEAVAAARQAVELAGKSGLDQTRARRRLCLALLSGFSARRDPDDLVEALTLAGEPPLIGKPTSDGKPTSVGEPTPVGEPLLFREDEQPPGGGDQVVGRLRAVLAQSSEIPPDERVARAATGLALATGDDRLALDLLHLAERHHPGDPGDFLLARARDLAGQHRYGPATALLVRAEQVFAAAYRELGEPLPEALQLGALGGLHQETGEPEKALECHRRAIALLQRSGSSGQEATHREARLQVARQHGHAAQACLDAGDPAAALAHALRAHNLHTEAGDAVAAALALAKAAMAEVVRTETARTETADPVKTEVAEAEEATAPVPQGMTGGWGEPGAGEPKADESKAGGDERLAVCVAGLEEAGAWEEACRVLDAHANLLLQYHHHDRAAACEARLVEIVRRHGRRREPADEWYRIAHRHRDLRDPAGAGVAFQRAEREYRGIGHHDGVAAVRYQLGVLAYVEGEPERAGVEFGRAAVAYGRVGDSHREASALSLRAVCLSRLDRDEDAAADLARAERLAAGDAGVAFIVTLYRATLDLKVGAYRRAGKGLLFALGLAAGEPLKTAVVRDRLAALAARTGDQQARIGSLELAVAAFRDAGQGRLAALASIRLGLVLKECGDPERARTALDEGLDGLPPALEQPPGATPHPSPGETEESGLPFELMVAATPGDPDLSAMAALAAMIKADLPR
ncbi:hypothetical protein HII36_48375 [Nonomuraea sp. NN258]|nr:hypothetical protein [Nonomuraea antri]